MKKYNILICLTIFAISFFSCQRELELPPALSFDGNATHTIAELLAMRTDARYDQLLDSMVIKGKVISSDKEGNCYKFLVIQDATGGIQIQINNSTLYQKYQIGQTVYVKCKELVLSEYNGLYQLNFLHQSGTLERIPMSKEASVIFRDSLAGKEPAATVIKTASDIKFSMYNTLVKLENCSFQNPGITYFDPFLGFSTTSCNVLLEDGSVIAARISQYATFAKELTPNGKGNITGILTVYKRNNGNIDNQLIIRSLADVQNFAEPALEETVVTVGMNVNPLSNGWSQANITGERKWEYANNILSITGESGVQNESYLISPVYSQLNHYKNVKLLLNHRIPGSMGNNQNMKIYYTTKALSGSFNASDWTELSTVNSQYPSAIEEITFELPEQATNSPNFRIALRYNDHRDSRWFIYGISFKGVKK